MTWRFLRAEEIQSIQAKLIDDYGGSHGLRDAGLLESAVARARNKVMYEDDMTAGRLAASVSYGLIKNHAFIDGNKRIGLAALNGYLKANGFFLDVSQEDAEVIVLRVAASEMTEADWTMWVERSVLPLRP